MAPGRNPGIVAAMIFILFFREFFKFGTEELFNMAENHIQRRVPV